MSANDANLQALSALPGVRSINIVNNVMRMYVKGPIDLKTLMREYSVIGADYPDKKFPSVTLHFAEDGPMPHSTVKIFAAGKLLCPGCATWDAAVFVLSTVVGFIQRVCPGVTAGPSHISNVVGCMALSVRIELELLSRHLAAAHDSAGCECTYNDEFSGIRFHDYDAEITYLIFWTGNVIITHGKRSDDITAAARKLYGTFIRCHEVNPNIFRAISKRTKKEMPLPRGFFRDDEAETSNKRQRPASWKPVPGPNRPPVPSSGKGKATEEILGGDESGEQKKAT